MWPWGHAAVGYLLYAGAVRLVRGDRPDGLAVLALLAGTQLPDLIDKPLAWSVALLPTGRSLGHSLLVIVPVVVVAWLLASSPRHRRLVAAVAVGWVSHSGGDAAGVLLGDNLAYANFLLWPVLRAPPYETAPTFAAHLTAVSITPFFLGQIVLTVVVAGLWLSDGCPGLQQVRRFARSARRRGG